MNDRAQHLDVTHVLLAHVLGAVGDLRELGTDQARVGVRRQQHDAHPRVGAPYDVGDDDAVGPQAVRQIEVGHKHVERRRGCGCDRTLGVLKGTDDRDRLVRQRGRQRRQQQGLVLE